MNMQWCLPEINKITKGKHHCKVPVLPLNKYFVTWRPKLQDHEAVGVTNICHSTNPLLMPWSHCRCMPSSCSVILEASRWRQGGRKGGTGQVHGWLTGMGSVLQTSGIRWWLSPYRSINPFCTPGYRVLMMLCRTRVAKMRCFTFCGVWYKVIRRHRK